MANIAIFRINYKSDFILTLNSDAGWMTPFCIKFWTGAPSQAYFVGFDGTTYTHCAPVDGDPTKLVVQFDDHHLPIGDLKFQIGYHFTVADFPTSVEDEVINQASVIIEVDDAPAQVMLDLNGETAPEIEFSLPAYANEAQRIANEEQRIAHEATRIVNEESRIVAETIRQQDETQRINNEAQRIRNEEARIAEFAQMKAEAIEATDAANSAAALANEKSALAADKAALAASAAQLANDKAALAQAAAQLANDKAQLAADKAALAQAASQLCDEKAALAQQKATYAQQQGDYSKAQGDYAKEQGDYSKAQGDYSKEQGDYSKEQGDYAKDKGDICAADHQTAVADHQTATADHQTAAADHQTATTDHNQAGNDHTRAESDHTRAESDHAAVEVYVDSLGAFDISAYNATGGVLAKYADLTAALGTNGANIPDALRKGGMSVKFVQTSDNKYVQYRLIPSSWSIDVDNWQSMNVDNAPAMGSKNLITSGAVYSAMLGVEKVVIIATANKGNVGDDAEIVVKVDNNVIATGTGSLTVAIAYDVNYTVECSRVYDYLTPAAQTFTAGLSVRNVTCAYTYIERDTITLDQTETDEESMITGDVQGDVIKAIRANSHLYLGTQTETGNQIICQLKDDDGTKYADGTTAAMDGTEGDQWLKLPIFWWKVAGIGTEAEDGSYDQYSFSFAYTGEPDPSWKKWEGNSNLLGAKEMTVVDEKGYTVSGGQSSASFTKAQGLSYASARGMGYSLVTWEWQWMMCVLFYAWYGRTNSQAQCGVGHSGFSRTLGTKDALGMTDTTISNGNSDNTKFWGIENWWGNKYELIGNVETDNYILTVVDLNTGESRTVSGWVHEDSPDWISRMKVTENLDFIPVEMNGTESTCFCDRTNLKSNQCLVYRSYAGSYTAGGVACVGAEYGISSRFDSIGSRLSFNGVVTEAESVVAYKALFNE